MGFFSKGDKAAKANQPQQQEKQEQKQKEALPTARYVHVPQHAEKDHLLAVPTAWKTDRKEKLKEAHAHRMAKEAARNLGSHKDDETRAVSGDSIISKPVSRRVREAIGSRKRTSKRGRATPSDEGYASLTSLDNTGKAHRTDVNGSRGPSLGPEVEKPQQRSDVGPQHEEDEIERLRRRIRELEAKQHWHNRQRGSSTRDGSQVTVPASG